MSIELPLPRFYDTANASNYDFRPDETALAGAAEAWRNAHNLGPAVKDRLKVHLLLIDLQKDFCFPRGSLYVGGRSGRGAIEDSDRVARFIYRNLGAISEITCTMDTHLPYQIFFSSFWLDSNDHHPPAHTEITTEDIESGRMRPNPVVAGWLCNGNYTWLARQVSFYCRELEKAGKYKLYLWPPHCLLGSAGHALVGVIQEARLFHAWTRGAKNLVEVKGGNTLTENYSVLSPEVLLRQDGLPLAQRNTQFIKTLLESDAVIIAGQASSHCVKSSIENLLGEMLSRDKALVEKVYILEDCMSPVAVPNPTSPGQFLFDFTSQAQDALKRFAQAGMHVVRSTDPMSQWLYTTH